MELPQGTDTQLEAVCLNRVGGIWSTRKRSGILVRHTVPAKSGGIWSMFQGHGFTPDSLLRKGNLEQRFLGGIWSNTLNCYGDEALMAVQPGILSTTTKHESLEPTKYHPVKGESEAIPRGNLEYGGFRTPERGRMEGGIWSIIQNPRRSLEQHTLFAKGNLEHLGLYLGGIWSGTNTVGGIWSKIRGNLKQTVRI